MLLACWRVVVLCVCISVGERVSVNVGQRPFAFDLEAYMWGVGVPLSEEVGDVRW